MPILDRRETVSVALSSALPPPTLPPGRSALASSLAFGPCVLRGSPKKAINRAATELREWWDDPNVIDAEIVASFG